VVLAIKAIAQGARPLYTIHRAADNNPACVQCHWRLACQQHVLEDIVKDSRVDARIHGRPQSCIPHIWLHEMPRLHDQV
jgi:hypothetical protein